MAFKPCHGLTCGTVGAGTERSVKPKGWLEEA